MPDVHFTPTPGGPTYRIVKNAEVCDSTYELRGARKKVHANSRPRTSESAQFLGITRRAAKLSIAAAPIENFSDVSKLIASLLPGAQIVALRPPITSNSDRVKQEKRNIRVAGFLYAARREPDNDYCLVVGREPNAREEMYMLMYVSGLPPRDSPTFGPLNSVRNTYERFFGKKNLPRPGYDFYEPPIPLKIEGSLFLNVTHSLHRPGPPRLRTHMPTIWHVHPITSIKLGP